MEEVYDQKELSVWCIKTSRHLENTHFRDDLDEYLKLKTGLRLMGKSYLAVKGNIRMNPEMPPGEGLWSKSTLFLMY